MVIVIVQVEEFCLFPRHGLKSLRFCLCQVYHPLVITKIRRYQLRQTIDAQTLDDEALKMPYQEIGQVKAAWLRIGQGVKRTAACIKLITVCTGYAFDPVFIQNPVEHTARAAVGVSLSL